MLSLNISAIPFIIMELAELVPSSNAQTLDLVRKTLEAHGVEFIGTPENAPGVRLK